MASTSIFQDAGTSSEGPVAKVPIHNDASTDEDMVYFEEINVLFPGVRDITLDGQVVEFSKGPHGETQVSIPQTETQRDGHGLCNRDLNECLAELERIVKRNVAADVTKSKESIMDRYDDMSEIISKLAKAVEQDRGLKEERKQRDEEILRLQTSTVEKLKTIHDQTNKILTQTFELHEYPIPRLFIILPKEDLTSQGLGPQLVDKFRLHFLCDCGEHTKPPPEYRNKSGASQGKPLPHCIHIAPHEGYDLVRPNEFFHKFGPHVLRLLKVIKYGASAAGAVVVPLSSISPEMGTASAMLKGFGKHLGDQVDTAINFLEHLTKDQDRIVEGAHTGPMMAPFGAYQREAVESPDIRYLETFLKRKDDAMAFGNLYRTVTSEGHVKWVCLDHYKARYREGTFKQLKDFIEEHKGTYDDHTGRVTIRLDSSELANKFYTLLRSTRFVHELCVAMDWKSTYEDILNLQRAIERSNVVHFELDGCNQTTPFLDKGNSWGRSDPIWQLMASGRLRSMVLKNIYKLAEHTINKPSKIYLSSLDLTQQPLGKQFLEDLISPWTSLETLKIQVPQDIKDLNMAFNGPTNSFSKVTNLTLRSPGGSEMTIHRNKDTVDDVSMSLRLRGREDPMAVKLRPVHKLAFFKAGAIANRLVLQGVFRYYTDLKALELECPASQFLTMLMLVQTEVRENAYRSLQQLRLVDSIGENSLTTDNILDTEAAVVCLNKISIKTLGGNGSTHSNLNWLIMHHGWKIKTLELGATFSRAQAGILLGSVEEADHSALENLTWHITEAYDEETFDMMHQFVKRSRSLPCLPSPSSSEATPRAVNIKMSVGAGPNRSPLDRSVLLPTVIDRFLSTKEGTDTQEHDPFLQQLQEVRRSLQEQVVQRTRDVRLVGGSLSKASKDSLIHVRRSFSRLSSTKAIFISTDSLMLGPNVMEAEKTLSPPPIATASATSEMLSSSVSSSDPVSIAINEEGDACSSVSSRGSSLRSRP
ncbi:MAG: hypothetical protein J3Q66DRAFT_436511 [Benniella sp.]|nr:MAG: hypothetical protein J3Q66DRAFT_436511 [Benniella sp.]